MNSKHKSIFSIFLFSLSVCFAKQANLSLVPFGESKATTEISFDWNEKYLTKTNSFDYSHDIARVACALSSMTYLDYNSMDEKDNILRDAYKKLGFADNNISFFYDVDFSDGQLGYDQCAFSIAHSNSAMIVAIRGVNYQNAYEWISCLNLSNDTKSEAEFHEGFYKPMLEVEKAIIEYMEKNNINRKTVRILVTGHSRGASIANLLGAQLAKDNVFPSEHIFAYTFASPNTTLDQDAQSERYGFIWNIVSAEDVVTKVPFNFGDWKYQKYGNTLVLANSWNTEDDVYNDEYLPKINSFFSKIKKRLYKPVGSASFFPTQIARLVTSINKSVDSYYNSPVSLYRIGKLFLEHTNPYDLMSRDFSSGTGLIDKAALLATERTNGTLDVNSVVDSHTCETYLSHLMVLDKKQAFSTLGSRELILKGTEEGVVLDKDGNVLLEFSNGRIRHKSIKRPIAAGDFGTDKIIIGLPANGEYTVLIAKDSLAPTPITAVIQNYDANGVPTEKLPSQKLYPYKDKHYAIKIARTSNTNANTSLAYSYETLPMYNYNLSAPAHFTVETNFDSNRNIGYGMHFGLPNSFYTSFLVSTGILRKEKVFDLQGGIGFGQTISGPFLADIEVLAKCRFTLDDLNVPLSEKINIIPSARASFSIVPLHRLRIFAAGILDLNTKKKGNAKVEPAVQIGLRF